MSSYSDDECAVPKDYASRVNDELMKAGMKGITVVASSGDNGIYGSILESYCSASPCEHALVRLFVVESDSN